MTVAGITFWIWSTAVEITWLGIVILAVSLAIIITSLKDKPKSKEDP
jgi:hypothetical protein